MKKMFLIFIGALVLQTRATDTLQRAVNDTFEIHWCGTMSGQLGCYQLTQITNGYLVFQHLGGYSGGIELVPSKPIAFRIKKPNKKLMAQLHSGMYLCQILEDGTRVHKVDSTQAETMRGFTTELSLFEVIP
jgi:hypothetical protein